jgi:hypothetical protein
MTIGPRTTRAERARFNWAFSSLVRMRGSA